MGKKTTVLREETVVAVEEALSLELKRQLFPRRPNLCL